MSNRRISSHISTTLNPFGPDWNLGTEKATSAHPIEKQVQDALFGQKKPQALEEDDFPDLIELLAELDRYRKKFAVMAGDDESDYRLRLAKNTIAMIDNQGTIYLGVQFLKQFAGSKEVIIGALAHEVGHRPKRWAEYVAKEGFTKEEREQLCRYEETRADLFAGKAMAEMGLSVEPMIQFLADIEDNYHPEYFPAQMRADVIREGFQNQKKMAQLRQNLWPQLEHILSPKSHLGDF